MSFTGKIGYVFRTCKMKQKEASTPTGWSRPICVVVAKRPLPVLRGLQNAVDDFAAAWRDEV